MIPKEVFLVLAKERDAQVAGAGNSAYQDWLLVHWSTDDASAETAAVKAAMSGKWSEVVLVIWTMAYGIGPTYVVSLESERHDWATYRLNGLTGKIMKCAVIEAINIVFAESLYGDPERRVIA